MEYSQLVKERYSVRKLSDQPVDETKLAAILEAARVAPTAKNTQPQRLLVIKTPEGMEKLKKAASTFNAPMAIIVCTNHDEAWIRPYDNYDSSVIDASIVGTHIMLAIHNEGLGSTWIGYFNPEVVREEFKLPANIEPVAIFPVGYIAPDAKPAHLHEKRRPFAETVVYESF